MTGDGTFRYVVDASSGGGGSVVWTFESNRPRTRILIVILVHDRTYCLLLVTPMAPDINADDYIFIYIHT